MRLVFIREKDQETFEVNNYPYGPFMLDKNTVIPSAAALDVTGYEYSGRDGGYQTSSRLQRRPFDLQFLLREDWTTNLGLFELQRQAQRFFDPHEDDLLSNMFTIEFYTDDRVKSSFMLRHGTISVPLGAKTEAAETRAQAQISFIFGDPYLYPIGDSGIGITTLRLFTDGGPWDVADGREWDEDDGAMWDEDDGKLWITAGGSSTGSAVAVDVVSTATVAAEIEAHGQLISPLITNLTNGSSFTYNGTLQDGDVLTVDSTGTVLLNGSTPPFTWSGTLTAQDGSNTFILQGAGGSTGHVDLTIRGAL